MEQRKSDLRAEGKGDPKYAILYRFVAEAKEEGFKNTYAKLMEHEKHAVITRLENQAVQGRVSYEFVERLRKELYGMIINDDGQEMINFEKQIELERALQMIYDILSDEKMQDFIRDRTIRDEDLYIIERLASFPKNMIIQCLHNVFSIHKERIGEELAVSIKFCADGRKKKLYETALDFYNKYGWAASWDLIRLLEQV